jgi:hypothetical protein
MDNFVNNAAKVTEMLKNAKKIMDDLHEVYPNMRDEAAANHDKKTLLDNLMMAATNAKDALCAPQAGGKRRKTYRRKTQRKRNY